MLLEQSKKTIVYVLPFENQPEKYKSHHQSFHALYALRNRIMEFPLFIYRIQFSAPSNDQYVSVSSKVSSLEIFHTIHQFHQGSLSSVAEASIASLLPTGLSPAETYSNPYNFSCIFFTLRITFDLYLTPLSISFTKVANFQVSILQYHISCTSMVDTCRSLFELLQFLSLRSRHL